MAAVASLGGGPAMQANKAAKSGPAMPKRSPGKPGKSIKGSPPSVGMRGPKPKGKSKPSLKKGTVKGISRKGVVNVKDMGIG
jgi:hypothetical protein